jgi:hypothetical protein
MLAERVAGVRPWLLDCDGAVVVRGKRRRIRRGFAGAAGGETGVVNVRLELGPWRRAGVSMGERMQGSRRLRAAVDGETQGYQQRNDERTGSRLFRKKQSKRRRGATGC